MNPVRPGRSEGKIQVQGREDDEIEIEAEVCEESRVPKKMQNLMLPSKAERDARVDPRAVQVVVRALRTRPRRRCAT